MSDRARIRIAHLPRFRFGFTAPVREGDLVMHEHKGGEWVRYDDLLPEVEALIRESQSDGDSEHG
jgi:hypothetical protein